MRVPRWNAPLEAGNIRPVLFGSKLALHRVCQNDVIEYDENNAFGFNENRNNTRLRKA